MSLDPQLENILRLIQKKAYPDMWELPVAEARALFTKTAPVLDARPEPVFRVEDRTLPGPAGDIPVRVYTPKETSGLLPVLVWVHGGGFVVGNLETADSVCRKLANDAECIVVSVDYRLAPEHKFPAAVEDVYAALEWVSRNAAELGGDKDRIAIGGDSAGGNLSSVCAILARDAGIRLRLQLLVYPGTAPEPDTESHFAFAEDHILTRKSILWFFDHYLNGDHDRQDFRYAPLIAEDHGNLAPAFMIVAGHDPLRDEGFAYERRLRAAGTPVELVLYEGMTHAFFSMSGALDAARDAVAKAAQALRKAFA